MTVLKKNASPVSLFLHMCTYIDTHTYIYENMCVCSFAYVCMRIYLNELRYGLFLQGGPRVEPNVDSHPHLHEQHLE